MRAFSFTRQNCLLVAGLLILCIAGGCSPQRDRYNLTEHDIDPNNLTPLGGGYAWGAGKLGTFMNGHGLPQANLAFVITHTGADGKPKLIWPAFDYGADQANAALLGDILVFAAGLPTKQPALMAVRAGEPPVVITAAVLRLAAQRPGTNSVLPGVNYRFKRVRLPPGRIWLKAAEMNGDYYSEANAFTVELTAEDLNKVMEETRQRGKLIKAKRFEYIAEAGAPCRIEASDISSSETAAAETDAHPKVAYAPEGMPYVPQPERLCGQGLADPIGRHVYFSTVHQPGRILKVALGDGRGVPPSVVGAVVLEPEENNVFYGAIDLAGQCAYLGTGYPGHIVKIALGVGDAPPYRVGSVLLDPHYNVRVGLVDSAAGYGYFNVGNRLYKLRLGKPDEVPVVVAKIELPNGNLSLESAAIDTKNHYAYFGGEWVKIYKVALGDGDAPPRLVGELTLPKDEGSLRGALIDPRGEYAWFASNRGSLIKISLGEKDNLPERIGALKLEPRFRYFEHTFGMDGAGYAYFGTTPSQNSVAAVLKIALGNGDELPRLVSSLVMKSGDESFATGIVDPVNRVMCLGMGAPESYLLSVRMGEEDNAPEIIGTKKLYP